MPKPIYGFCEECGEYSYDLIIHHKNRNHFDNSPDNKQLICSYCHGLEHGVEGAMARNEQYSFDLVDELSNKRVGYRLQRYAWMNYLTTEELPETF